MRVSTNRNPSHRSAARPRHGKRKHAETLAAVPAAAGSLLALHLAPGHGGRGSGAALQRDALDMQHLIGNRGVERLLGPTGTRPAAVARETKPRLKTPMSRPESIPGELLRPVDVGSLSDADLEARHEAILKLLEQFGGCPADPADDFWVLTNEAQKAGTELARRSALAAGRTFSEEEVQKARDAFRANARKAPGGGRKECIVILNHVLKEIWEDPAQKHTNETIEKTMKLFEAGGRIGGTREIWFTNSRGQVTKGGARPEGIQESVWEAVVQMAGADPGWSMFGLSIMDGYHAVTLTLDNNDPASPKVYWSDQVPGWSSGWKEYGKTELNVQLLRMVQRWWDGQPAGRKHTTIIRLWRLRRTPQGQSREE